MKKRFAFLFAAVATLGLGAFYVPAAKNFGAIDRCLAADRAWDYRAGRCQPLPPGPVDRIVVDKSDRLLAAYRGGELVREFRVALGRGGIAPKQKQGDRRVPEGNYLITFHNDASRFHRSLRIGYPTAEQLESAQLAGTNLGGDIMIHGLPNGLEKIGSRHLRRDWTDGCIAVTNAEMDWLFETVAVGTPIEIRA